jgi:hypothetical protein
MAAIQDRALYLGERRSFSPFQFFCLQIMAIHLIRFPRALARSSRTLLALQRATLSKPHTSPLFRNTIPFSITTPRLLRGTKALGQRTREEEEKKLKEEHMLNDERYLLAVEKEIKGWTEEQKKQARELKTEGRLSDAQIFEKVRKKKGFWARYWDLVVIIFLSALF